MKLKNLRHIEKIEEPYVFIQIMYTFGNILISCIFEHFHEYIYIYIISIQFSSAAQLCPTLCDHMDGSMPGLPVHHQLPEFTQTHVH